MKWLQPVLIWLVGASLGFGGSQLMFVGPIREQVREHTVRLNSLEAAGLDNNAVHERMREDFTRRLTTLVGEQANYVSISREFILATRADRELMQQQLKQNAELIEILKRKQ